MTFEIESITYQLGEEEILVRDLCDRNNLNFDRLITRSGFETVYRTNLSEEDFFSEFIKMNLNSNTGDFIIFVNQSMSAIIPGKISRIFCNLLDTDNAYFIEISDGCSGFVRAFVLAVALLEAKITSRVHVICAEKYSKYFLESDKNVSPIFSDAISLTTVCQGNKYSLVSTAVKNFLPSSKLISTQINADNDLKLNMEGGSVLSWVLSTVPAMIDELLVKSNLEKHDVNHWFLHQGSRVVVEMLEERLGLVNLNLFKSVNVGNSVSSSIPIIWKSFFDAKTNALLQGETIVLAGFGVGLSAMAAGIRIEQ